MEISLESQGTEVREVKAAANMGIKRKPGLSMSSWVVMLPMVAMIISRYSSTTSTMEMAMDLGTVRLGFLTSLTRKAMATTEP